MKRKHLNKPPDPLFRARSCTGKKRYRSEQEAAAMIRTQIEYGKPMEDVHPYRCRFCNQWHIGHRMVDD